MRFSRFGLEIAPESCVGLCWYWGGISLSGRLVPPACLVAGDQRGFYRRVGAGFWWFLGIALSVRGVSPLPCLCLLCTDELLVRGHHLALYRKPTHAQARSEVRRGGGAEERARQSPQAHRADPRPRHQPRCALRPPLTAVWPPPLGTQSTARPRRGPESGSGPAIYFCTQPSFPNVLWGCSVNSPIFRITYHHIAARSRDRICVLGGPGTGAPGLGGRHLRR
ncbi:hypothetical protein NDU88_009236 [Pleurodeles waltl]|uniref:Uncharacterized protein n=1 Tax=Pleurodeles waltl TaxID=8319 RepID=A0AAV7QV67_PLEWA|nr:hypothetical protein NDU88_009236 [Pleurodeles waltl]